MAKTYPKIFFGDKLVDSDQANLSVMSSAVLYGLSVYTVFPVLVGREGRMVAFRLPDHYQRLCESAKIIGIDGFAGHWDFKKFLDALGQLVAANKIESDTFV